MMDANARSRTEAVKVAPNDVFNIPTVLWDKHGNDHLFSFAVSRPASGGECEYRGEMGAALARCGPSCAGQGRRPPTAETGKRARVAACASWAREGHHASRAAGRTCGCARRGGEDREGVGWERGCKAV